MNTLDDLRSALDSYADRGEPRGAESLWDPANRAGDIDPAPTRDAESSSRRALLAVAVAATFVLVVGIVTAVRSSNDDIGVVTVPDVVSSPVESTSEPSTEPAAIVVPDGIVSAVHVAFDRTWVAMLDPALLGGPGGRLRSYDVATGELVSDVAVTGASFWIVSTDRSVWLRSTTDGPASFALPDGTRGDNALFHVDPGTGEVTIQRVLNGDGGLAAASDRVAAPDHSHVEVVADDGTVLGSASIDEAVGVEQATFPGTNAFGGLAFASTPTGGAPAALYGIHQGRGELIELDPTTGWHVATRIIDVERGQLGRVVLADGVAWVTVFGIGASTVVGIQTPLATSTPESDRVVAAGKQVLDIAPLDGSRFVALERDEVSVAGGTADDEITTAVDPDATGQLVTLGGEPWVALWPASGTGAEAEISFVRVRTDASMPEIGGPTTIAPTTTAAATTPTSAGPPATLTIMTPQPLDDGQTIRIAAAGLPAGADVTFSVCLPGDPADIGFCEHHVEPHPVPTARVGNSALFTDWTVTRSVYDGTWHDCAFEACVLRVYPVDASGFRNTTTVLAETPITFAADGPLLRPTLTVTPAGPITVGSTVTITGERFPPGARNVDIGICRTGDHDASCYLDLDSMGLNPDAAGRFVATFTVVRATIGAPQIDPRSPLIDCTAAPGTCSFNVFPMDGSREPYATVRLEMRNP